MDLLQLSGSAGGRGTKVTMVSRLEGLRPIVLQDEKHCGILLKVYYPHVPLP